LEKASLISKVDLFKVAAMTFKSFQKVKKKSSQERERLPSHRMYSGKATPSCPSQWLFNYDDWHIKSNIFGLKSIENCKF